MNKENRPAVSHDDGPDPRVPDAQGHKKVRFTEQPVTRVDPIELKKLKNEVESTNARNDVKSTKSESKLKSILREPKLQQQDNSIASRVKARRQETDTPAPFPSGSIAERVAARCQGQETANPVLDYETGNLLEYRQLLRHPKYSKDWNISAANEFGRLAQGDGGQIKGTNTIHFIQKDEIPLDWRRDVTFLKFVCMVRTEKAEPNRTRETMGGNLINYPEDVGTPTANLLWEQNLQQQTYQTFTL